MNFDQKLINKHPILFYEKEKGDIHCLGGIWIPKGWENIVENLCDAITAYDQSPTLVKINQIKEKLGGLRFYYSGGDEKIWGMVYFAEYLCSKTCEVSGGTGELCHNGFCYKTLSKEVREQEPYKDYKPI